jgi:PAS domain S-box-containing protein
MDTLEKDFILHYGVEYMDAKAMSGARWERSFYDRLDQRYNVDDLDVIIATDNAAIEFLLKHKTALFGQTPVVFCGLNGYVPGMFVHRKDFVGVAEKLSLRETVDMAVKMHPGLRKVALFHEDTPFGRMLREFAIDELIGSGLETQVVSGGTMAELMREVEALDKDSILLLLSFFKDSTGEYYSQRELANLLGLHARVPKYVLFNMYMEGGDFVGGKLVDGYSMGAKTGEMVTRLLKGEDIQSLRVEVAENRWIFNKYVLQRMGIPLDMLPDNAILITEDEQDYYYSEWVLVAFFAAGVLLGGVILFARLSFRLGQFKSNADRLKGTLEHAVNPVLTLDEGTGLFVYANRVASEVTGYSLKELKSIGPSVLLTEFTRAGFELMYAKLKNEVLQEPIETALRCKDGLEIPIELSVSYFNKGSGGEAYVMVLRDISKRVRAEDALRQSEERFKTVVHQSPTAIELFSMDGFQQEVNPAWVEMWQIDPEVTIKKFNLLTDPQIKNSPIYPAVLDAFSGKATIVDEFYFDPLASGFEARARYVRAQIYPIFNVQGEQVSVALSLQDITDHKMAKQELEESEKRFKVLFDQTFQYMGLLTPEGAIIEVNGTAREVSLKEPEPLTGKNVWDVLWWGYSQTAREQAKDAVFRASAGEVVRYQTMYRTDEGKRAFMDVTFKPVLDARGRISNLIFEGRDITQIRRAMEEVRALRNRLRNVIDSMPSAVVGAGLDGRVTLWNKGAELFTGTAKGEATGRLIAEVFPFSSEDVADMQSAIETGRLLSRTKVPYVLGETSAFVDYTVYPITGTKDEGAVIRIDDVSERVRLEQLMVQSEKMMSVGGLAAGMAHEINNPLGGILQGAQNILRRISPDLVANHKVAELHGISIEALNDYLRDRKILNMVEGIRDSGKRAAEIVSGMLEFSRKSDSTMGNCNLNRLVEDALELASSDYDMTKQYDFRDIRILKDFDPGLDEIQCVKSEIEQVLLNLLRNAAQSMSAQDMKGKRPTIVIRTHARGDIAVLEVEDNGPGMSEETRKRVFEPFFTTKDPGVGAGLGLSVSYFIITQNHGGEFTVESKPGIMTKFIIRVPVDPQISE